MQEAHVDGASWILADDGWPVAGSQRGRLPPGAAHPVAPLSRRAWSCDRGLLLTVSPERRWLSRTAAPAAPAPPAAPAAPAALWLLRQCC